MIVRKSVPEVTDFFAILIRAKRRCSNLRQLRSSIHSLYGDIDSRSDDIRSSIYRAMCEFKGKIFGNLTNRDCEFIIQLL